MFNHNIFIMGLFNNKKTISKTEIKKRESEIKTIEKRLNRNQKEEKQLHFQNVLTFNNLRKLKKQLKKLK